MTEKTRHTNLGGSCPGQEDGQQERDTWTRSHQMTEPRLTPQTLGPLRWDDGQKYYEGSDCSKKHPGQ